ncbi:MAG: DNA replication complex GINS family protein [Candidatus Bathyarchaeota archaeon]|nr:MAG: DNA replication complex GINS family protein [Candidatus Bathyarchaeota archaeon]
MYDTLYNIWKKENENPELQTLPKNFYTELADYLGRIRQGGRMLDRKSIKAKLTSQEFSNAHQLAEKLVRLRFNKIVNLTKSAKRLNKEILASEEKRIFLGLKPSFENLESFLKSILRGRISTSEEESQQSGKKLVRFLQDVPSIVGADLEIYGPFSVEDVATLPNENAETLVKQGIVMEIETS